MKDSPECGNCRFFLAEDKGDSGECRRYPPVPLIDEGEWVTIWPAIDSDDFCGEWKPAQ